MGKSVAPGPQEEALMKNADAMINSAVTTINTFHDKHWKAYRQFVEGTRVSLFKDYEPIK
jgi:hypothetical protein